MAVSNATWVGCLERVYRLRRDKRQQHERPHKPVLLLSLIDLLDRGLVSDNSFPLSEELVRTFKRHFAAVCAADDRPSIEQPYFHLAGDGFWQLVPAPGCEPIYRPGEASGAPSVATLRRRVLHGTFDDEFWRLLSDPVSRHQLREAIIARYFANRRDSLTAVIVESRQASAVDTSPPDALPPTPARDSAFRRAILEIYDYRCAACGVRVLLNHGICLVEAAHLIPFAVSRNDNPNNGLALCPNHHWAMDRHLIAPCPPPPQETARTAGVWRVNGRQLDDRFEGQRDLLALDGKRVIPPAERMYYPSPEALRWREEQLRESGPWIMGG